MNLIARGGMGRVYKAVQLSMDRQVALKTLGSNLIENEQFVARFLREARKAFEASDSCSGACRMYGCVHRDGALCLVMRLYPRSLHAFLDTRRSADGSNWIRPLAYGEVVSFTEQILVALGQLHAEGIVVQDLKPANLLLDYTNRIKICDFGSVRQEHHGTPHLRPPASSSTASSAVTRRVAQLHVAFASLPRPDRPRHGRPRWPRGTAGCRLEPTTRHAIAAPHRAGGAAPKPPLQLRPAGTDGNEPRFKSTHAHARTRQVTARPRVRGGILERTAAPVARHVHYIL